MALKVEVASEGNLPTLGQTRGRVEPVSATYQVHLAGKDLVALRRIGGTGGVLAAIEAALDLYIHTGGAWPLDSPGQVLAAAQEADEHGGANP